MFRVVIFLSLYLLALKANAGSTVYYQVNSLNDVDDGACDASHCSLREAIKSTDFEPDPVVIDFEPGLTGTIALNSELKIVGNDITIIGPGEDVITLSGQNNSRVLWITIFSENISVSGLTIADGSSGTDRGAGIYARSSHLLLENLRIINNYNLTLGAGLSYFDGNNAVFRNIELSGNESAGYAGLVINGGDGTVLLENITVSGNISDNQNPISGFNIISNPGTTTLVRYMTVADNINGDGGSIGGSDPTIIEASVFADNEGSFDVRVDTAAVTFNNSIIEHAAGTVTGANNVVGQNPNLKTLMFLPGAKQQVHTFMNDSSVALNFVDNSLGDAQCGQGVLYDQINMPRPQGGRCDAGAYEQYVEDVIFMDGFE